MSEVRPSSADRPALPWLRLALLALATVGLGFGWTLDGYFVGDDFGYVARHVGYPLAEWPRLFVRDWTEGIFDRPMRELRPLIALTYIVDADLWGVNPEGFRLTNLLLHSLTAFGVGLLAWRASGRDGRCALLATVLFALHPVQAEPVAWITGRNDMLPTLCMVGAIACFLRYRERGGTGWLFGLIALQGTALFARESGIILGLFLVAVDLAWLGTRPTRRLTVWLPYLGCAAMLVLYSFCRRAAFGSGGPGAIGAGLPDLTDLETYTVFLRHQLGHAAHLLGPLDHVARTWRTAPGSLPALGGSAIAAIALVALAILVRRSWRNLPGEARRATLCFGPAWLTAATVPLVMTYFSPRHLYPAVVGLAIVIPLLLRGLWAKPRPWILAAATVALAWAAVLGFRLQAWHQAALTSRLLAADVSRLETEGTRGPLFLDVPAIHDGAWCWSWAVPHALRPPFTRTRVDEPRIVVARPEVFANPRRSAETLPIEALAHADEPAVLLRVLPDGSVSRTAVSPAAYQAAAAKVSAVMHPDRHLDGFLSALPR